LNLHKALILWSVAAPALAQYAGPAILSRGEAPAAMQSPQIDFRPFLTVTGTYDTGLAGVAVNSSGQLVQSAAYGTSIAAGISGTHSWKHTKLGLDYSGSYSHLFGHSFYDSTTQTLSLGLTHQFSRHVLLNLRENAGIFSQNFLTLGLPQTVPFDPSQSNIPVTDFFNNRTYYLTSQADLIYQRSTRMSFDFGGDVFFTRYRSKELFGPGGYTARGDMEYRISRHTTIGGEYSFTHYDFTHLNSSTDFHQAGLTFASRLTQWWELTGYFGAIRAETYIVEAVPLDPKVAALLGVSAAPELIYSLRYVPAFGVRLSRTFHYGVFYITGARTVVPGNGLFLTSIMTNAAAGYTYTGLRRWSFTMQALFDRGSSLGNIIGTYGDISTGFSMSRQITGGMHFVAGGEARRYQSPSFNQYNRNVYDAHIGLGFTPGNVPLRLW